jgi:UDP:flavonoid glycosyltransferase YjiC (YdhE family)
MALVACCWELGNGFGHIGELLQWARPLKEHGHRVVFFVKELFPAAVLLHQEGFECLPGVHLPPTAPPISTSTYAQLLLLNGFRNHDNLAAGLACWASIFRSYKPALVICNYAPTAALAARALNIHCVLSGTSFSTPPAMTSSQTFVAGNPEQIATDLATFRQSLEVAGKNSGLPENIFSLEDPLAGCIPVLQTFPELDLYERENAKYVGSGFGLVTKQIPPEWPMRTSHRPKIFAYIGGPSHAVERFLSIIPRVDAQFIAFIRNDGNNAPPLPRYSNAVFPKTLIDLNAVFTEVDLIINHGAHGTFCGCLKAGKPMVLAPNFPEQVCHSRKVEKLGAASVVLPSATPKNFRDTVEEALQNIATFRQAAETFSQRYPEADMLKRHQQVIEEMLPLLN